MSTTSQQQRVLPALVVSITLVFLAARCGGQNPPGDLLLNDPENITGNASRNCLSRSDRAPCPDPDLHFFLYAGTNGEAEEVNVSDPEWLSNSRFDQSLPTVLLIHGYRGGDSLMPVVILKNEYIRLGQHNLITVDWGEFVRAPCYLQALGNIKVVSRCTGHLLTFLEDSGVDIDNVTCVGHSLGAHVCGQLANHAPKKLQKIIALDPARPFFVFAFPDDKLDDKDAKVVQVIHTNTGFYGLSNMQGTADICINRGVQPFCEKTRNAQLCSHIHAVCFMAESLNPNRARKATPCNRNCPHPERDYTIEGEPVFVGHFMEESASGMYCLEAETPPFCRQENSTDLYGSPHCCPVERPRTLKTFSSTVDMGQEESTQ